jgi:hypothetical protein
MADRMWEAREDHDAALPELLKGLPDRIHLFCRVRHTMLFKESVRHCDVQAYEESRRKQRAVKKKSSPAADGGDASVG